MAASAASSTGLSNETLWLVTAINSFSGFIIIPILGFYLYQFSKRKDELCIAKRYPFLVRVCTLLTILVIPVSSSLNSVRRLSPLLHTNDTAYTTLARVQNIIVGPTVYAIDWLFITRVWLISYDLNYANSNMNKQWKSHLDLTLIDQDFWLKHRNTYGNANYMLRFTFVMFTIYTIPTIVLVQIYIGTDTMKLIDPYLGLTLHLSIVFILIFFYIRLPRVLDLFYLRWEVKRFVLILIGGLFWFILMNQVIQRVNNDTVIIIAFVLKMNTSILGYLAMSLTSTSLILRKLDGGLSSSHLKQINRQNARELQRVLLDPHNFELFVQHLAREFCIETILSFIEMVQFKHLINVKFAIDINLGRSVSYDGDCELDTELFYDFDRCDINRNTAIPRSFIVCKSDLKQKDHNDLAPFLILTHALFSKYIAPGAELEINISGAVRESYLKDMECGVGTFIDNKLNNDNPMEAIDVFEYFDECIEEMYC
eukprot:913456_1